MQVEVGPNTAREDEDMPSRTVSLAAAELAEMDREIDSHRIPSTDLCTTSFEFDIVVSDATGELRREHVADSSCAYEPPIRGRHGFYALLRPRPPGESAP